MRGGWALLAKDFWSMLNLRRQLRQESRFKMVFVLLFGLGLLAGMWRFFLAGFRFLDKLGGVGVILIDRLFAVFLWGLGVMLAISSIVTYYSTAFASRETAYLLLKPVRRGTLSLYKWVQSTFFASWAFFFAVVPFVGAYGQHQKMPITFAVWTAVYAVPLVFVCCGFGSLVCLMAVRWFPRIRYVVTVVFVVLAALLVLALASVRARWAQTEDTTLIISQLLPGIQVASHPLWPTTWAAEGILSASRGYYGRALGMLYVLIVNVLMLGMMIERVGEKLFFESWHRLYGSMPLQRRPRSILIPCLAGRARYRDILAIVLKDIQIFVRDPAQWLQGLVFFGLLGLYFVNLRSFRYHLMPDEWRNLIAYLNVFSVSSVVCSFGARFIYPQLSLEGQSFWIVGLAPTRMFRILVGKFLFSLIWMAPLSMGLMGLAGWQLSVGPATAAVAVAVACCVSVAVSGLSTGLGAIFLNLRERNPAAIVSSFGGTLNLVLSLAFMLAVITPYAAIFHLHALRLLAGEQFRMAVAVTSAWMIVLTIAATAIPLLIGGRMLESREY